MDGETQVSLDLTLAESCDSFCLAVGSEMDEIDMDGSGVGGRFVCHEEDAHTVAKYTATISFRVLAAEAAKIVAEMDSDDWIFHDPPQLLAVNRDWEYDTPIPNGSYGFDASTDQPAS